MISVSMKYFRRLVQSALNATFRVGLRKRSITLSIKVDESRTSVLKAILALKSLSFHFHLLCLSKLPSLQP